MLAACAPAQVATQATATIEAANGTANGTAIGANVVLDIVSQTNLLLTVSGPGLAVTSVSVPQSLAVTDLAEGTDVRLPTVVTAPSGGSAITAPNSVAMSVGDGGGAPNGTGPNDVMLVVVQYN